MEAPPPDAGDEGGARLWPLAARSAAKGKLLPPAEAERFLADPDLEAFTRACAAIQTWCWVRGMPPLDRAIALERAQGPVRVFVDYDVFFEAMTRNVHNERFVLSYPWDKVREPTPEALAWAKDLVARHGPLVRRFRFLDLELELRERDAARGTRRPPPEGFTGWGDVETEHARAIAELATAGATLEDLRPPGVAPYPPPGPRETSWSH